MIIHRSEMSIPPHYLPAMRYVYGYLRQNYPADVIEWAKRERWERKRVPLADIKMARRPGGRNMQKVEAIQALLRDDEKLDRVVLVETKDGYKIADGYHRTLAAKRENTRYISAWVATGEHDKGPWDEEMHAAKLNKGYGDGARTPSPLVTTPTHQPHADTFLLEWGADTHVQGYQSVYNLYRKVMGHNAKDGVSIEATDTSDDGTTYLADDGEHKLRIYLPANGPARLLKALATYTPTANTVWSILFHEGYDFKPKNGTGEYGGCRVKVDNHRVTVSGRHAKQIFQLLIDRMKQMQTSEDWVDGHMTMGRYSDRPKPW